MLPAKWVMFLLLLMAFELAADVLAKQFALSGRPVFALTALAGFVSANMAWLLSLRTGAELSRGAVLFSVLSAVGAVLIGLILYHEKASARQPIGLVLGLATVAFLAGD
jgi:multidrug transporter EmrE-like cation transporter